jgi:hypothetical protein
MLVITLFQKLEKFSFYYNVYDLHLKIAKAFFKYWHEK